MAKGGKSSNGAGIPQKHLHSRVSYLYQAAMYLAAAEKEAQHQRLKAPMNGPASSKESQPEGLQGPHNATEPVRGGPQAPGTDESQTTAPHRQPVSNTDSIAPRRFSPQSRHLLTSMRSVSQKSQIRLSRSIKRSVCRRCDALLAQNSTVQIENASRGGRKPWADVLVVRCEQCGFLKRYPVGMGEEGRQKTSRKLDHAAVEFHQKVQDAEEACGS